MRSPLDLIRELFGTKERKKKKKVNDSAANAPGLSGASEEPGFTEENESAANKALALFRATEPKDMKSVIGRFMQKKKPFLLNRYTIYQLSEDTGIAASELASYITLQNYQNFREFINEYRIIYCRELMENAPRIKASIFELSILCGFTSQREFSTSFKKVMQTTFSDYKKKIYGGKRSQTTAHSA
jgi:AraC-like DNA-binding protein